MKQLRNRKTASRMVLLFGLVGALAALAGVRVLYRPNGVAPLVFDGGSPITSLQACKSGQGLPFRGGGCGP